MALTKRGRPKKQDGGGRNEPWNPRPPMDVPTVSMFKDCDGGHVMERHLPPSECKACQAGLPPTPRAPRAAPEIDVGF